MNLVGGYESSDDEEETSTTPQSTVAPRLAEPSSAARSQLHQAKQQTPGDGSSVNIGQKRSGDRGGGSRKGNKPKLKRKERQSTKKRGVRLKKINAIVLSPEIQAALARGDTLGDSDSDDAGGTSGDKRPKVSRTKGASNDLLSLLPQPSTLASAEQILLKSKQKREKASAAKEAKRAVDTDCSAESKEQGLVATSTGNAVPGTTGATEATMERGSKSASAQSGIAVEGEEDEEPSGDDDDSDEDLLANMRARANTANDERGSLFTLPSRSRPRPQPVPPIVAMSIAAASGEDTGVPLVGSPTWKDKQHPDGSQNAGEVIAGQQPQSHVPEEPGASGVAARGVWIAPQAGFDGSHHPYPDGRAGYAAGGPAAAAAAGGQYEGTGDPFRPVAQAHHHAGVAASSYAVGGQGMGLQVTAAQGGLADDGGVGAKGKAGRRRGRDMERALASGNLGALGDETPTLELEQGSNEYVHVRSTPITAAMQQEQKRIEGSVYDPRTGKTVTTSEPTSLQRRKHQINQLAVQAANMERDLLERSGASRLTKAQTQAKYGW